MVKNLVIIGAQWGDEGKGKIVDILTKSYDCVVRFQGGHNAGHTLVVNNKKTILHLIPSGILHDSTCCVIAGGVVVNLAALFTEIDMLSAAGIQNIQSRLKLSRSCPLILSSHIALDKAREQFLGKAAIGTTGRGIGPTYEDKVARRGLRISDLLAEDFAARLAPLVEYHNFLLQHYFQVEPVAYDVILSECLAVRDRIEAMCIDVPKYLAGLNQQGSKILFEGAQGALLDIDHGTYPYVTSSNTLVGGVAASAGIAMQSIGEIIGIAKMYATRVGAGPFVTELHDDVGQLIAERGRELGSTTGRPRRCGWLDMPALRRVAMLNGITAWCLTKLDVLDTLAEIKVCVAYQLDGERYDIMPDDMLRFHNVEPIYEVLPGWQEETLGITKLEKLPLAARQYIDKVREWTGVNVAYISTGPDRDHIIM